MEQWLKEWQVGIDTDDAWGGGRDDREVKVRDASAILDGMCYFTVIC